MPGIAGRTDLNVCMGDLAVLTGGGGKPKRKGGLFSDVFD